MEVQFEQDLQCCSAGSIAVIPAILLCYFNCSDPCCESFKCTVAREVCTCPLCRIGLFRPNRAYNHQPCLGQYAQFWCDGSWLMMAMAHLALRG